MDVQTDYREEIRRFKSTGAKVWFGLLLLLLALLAIPAVLESHLLSLLALVAIHIIIAIGLNLLTGYTGQISLGHAGFSAIGAYTSSPLMLKLHLPSALALSAAQAFLPQGDPFAVLRHLLAEQQRHGVHTRAAHIAPHSERNQLRSLG